MCRASFRRKVVNLSFSEKWKCHSWYHLFLYVCTDLLQNVIKIPFSVQYRIWNKICMFDVISSSLPAKWHQNALLASPKKIFLQEKPSGNITWDILDNHILVKVATKSWSCLWCQGEWNSTVVTCNKEFVAFNCRLIFTDLVSWLLNAPPPHFNLERFKFPAKNLRWYPNDNRLFFAWQIRH